MKIMRKLPENLAQAKAGEYSVAAQLLLRGHNPFFPAVDIGADVMLDSGVKVQVKSAHLRFQRGVYEQGAYWFKLATRAVISKGRVQKRVFRIFSNECDFVVLWGIEQNRFWIVPAAVFDGHQSVIVGPDAVWINDSQAEKVRQARIEGKTFRTIAKELGISAGSAYMIASDKRVGPSNRTTLASEVRSYENRWELIESYASTMQEAEIASAVIEKV